MENKYLSYTSLALIFFALLSQFYLPDYSQYTANLEDTKIKLENKMVERCIKLNEPAFITMGEGLNGECGILQKGYDEEKDCYIFITYGENITSKEQALELYEAMQDKPSEYISLGDLKIHYKWISIFLISLALILQLFAILRSFRKNLQNR